MLIVLIMTKYICIKVKIGKTRVRLKNTQDLEKITQKEMKNTQNKKCLNF
jgi:hypothetical protein